MHHEIDGGGEKYHVGFGKKNEIQVDRKRAYGGLKAEKCQTPLFTILYPTFCNTLCQEFGAFRNRSINFARRSSTIQRSIVQSKTTFFFKNLLSIQLNLASLIT